MPETHAAPRASLESPDPPSPSPSPSPRAVSPVAIAMPAAFGATNVFTFGSAPQSNFAKPTDAVQIYYATFSPTVVDDGTSVSVAAITSSNVASAKLVIGSRTVMLNQTSPGQWQGTFAFPASGLTGTQNPFNVSLIATRSDGGSANITIPVNVESH
jgi:hypothetical protein